MTMDLGAFSVSLAVKDLEASRAFYEKLGFTRSGGDAAQNWLILQNGDHVIGLFQGMFERNMLTFNPGWDRQRAAARRVHRRARAAAATQGAGRRARDRGRRGHDRARRASWSSIPTATRSSSTSTSDRRIAPVEPRLTLSRAQILAFRRRVGALDERLPRGAASLRRRRGPA